MAAIAGLELLYCNVLTKYPPPMNIAESSTCLPGPYLDSREIQGFRESLGGLAQFHQCFEMTTLVLPMHRESQALYHAPINVVVLR